MHWKLSLSDIGEMLFLPPLPVSLRSKAPNTQLVNLSIAAAGVPLALESREVDFAIGILQPSGRGLHSQHLFSEYYVAVSSTAWEPKGDHNTRTLTRLQLERAFLAVASPTATSHKSVEQMLQHARLGSRVAVRAKHFGAPPELAMNSDLLMIVPLVYAQARGCQRSPPLTLQYKRQAVVCANR